MKAARRPFRFEAAAILTRLTNRRARTLAELRDGLAVATTSMIFHHTYTSHLERHFVPASRQNDFVFWVDRTLRQRALAERLAAVDPYAYTDLQEVRKRLLAVVEEHLERGGEDSAAPPDQEFHFLESVNVASPTPFLAQDLRDFRDDLARIGLRSIYHHFLTARLRIGRPTNDFSVWLEEELDERALARSFERIDPDAGTLEETRARMMRLVDEMRSTRNRNRVFRLSLIGASVIGALGVGARAAGKRIQKQDRSRSDGGDR